MADIGVADYGGISEGYHKLSKMFPVYAKG